MRRENIYERRHSRLSRNNIRPSSEFLGGLSGSLVGASHCNLFEQTYQVVCVEQLRKGPRTCRGSENNTIDAAAFEQHAQLN